MKNDLTLTITSLLSILLVAFHISEDIVRGFEPGRLSTFSGVLMLALWMYGTLVLGGRRSGYLIMCLGAILGTVVSIAHMRGAGLVGGRVANSSGMFFWVFTQLALGVTAVFSLSLSAYQWWTLRRTRTSAIASSHP
jgi:hypothetical protein